MREFSNLFAHFLQPAAFARQFVHHREQLLARQLAVRHHPRRPPPFQRLRPPRARPARSNASAVRRWGSPAAKGTGTSPEGFPAAASSATVAAPARQTTRSACANAAGISLIKGATSPLSPVVAKSPCNPSH